MGWTWGIGLLLTGGWVTWMCSRRGHRPLLATACTACLFASAFWFVMMPVSLFAGLTLQLREVKGLVDLCIAFSFYCAVAVVPLGIASRIAGVPPESDGVGLSGREAEPVKSTAAPH